MCVQLYTALFLPFHYTLYHFDGGPVIMSLCYYQTKLGIANVEIFETCSD